MKNPPSKRSDDRLPPHDAEAEKAVLGAVLTDAANANQSVAEMLKRFATDEPFFVTANRIIFLAFKDIYSEGKTVDLVTVHSRLKDWGKLEDCGGMGYLASLEGMTTLLSQHLEIIWEKFIGRMMLQMGQEIVNETMALNGVTEGLLAKSKRLQEEMERKVRQADLAPKYLKDASEYSDEVMHEFFSNVAGTEPGAELPIAFPLKIREGETTLVTGDDKAGKSTVLSYFALHLANPAARVCIASMEMSPHVSLWVLASQLLGTKNIPAGEAGRQRVVAALAWLNARFKFFAFLGIANWRELLDTFRFAAEHQQCKYFILDSVMRIGIGDDDYAQQAVAAAMFAQFAIDYRVHLKYVIHENKGDHKGKNKIRGSKLWSANACNILRIERNLEKGEKADKIDFEISQEKRQASPDWKEIKEMEADLERMRKEWDTRLVLQGQRWPGSQQNGAKYIWFNKVNFQFRNHWEDETVCWLDHWKKTKTKEKKS